MNRRELIQRAGKGFAGLALAGMADAQSEAQTKAMAKAKNIIYIFNHGGVSHVDTFDPKPTLTRLSGETVPASFAQGLKTSRAISPVISSACPPATRKAAPCWSACARTSPPTRAPPSITAVPSCLHP